MQQEELNFSQLEKRIEQFLREEEQAKPGRLERWSFWIGLVAAAITVLLGVFDTWPYKVAFMAIGLALELIGLIVAIGCMAVREWRNSTFAYSGFARDLDRGFTDYRNVVAWLMTFPEDLVGSRLRYIKDRKARFSYRFGLFVGGAERLGVLPLLVVLYIQFKDWTFGDWQALGHIHMLGGLLLWALLLIYVGGWWLSALKERIDLYEMLLTEASVAKPA